MWNKFRKYALPYIVGILIPLGVGALSAFLTRDPMKIYDVIEMPPLSPPGIAFPIVWTVLYVLMGISSVTVCLARTTDPAAARLGIFRYCASLVFNFFWSIIFFNLHSPIFAFAVILVLFYLIVMCVISYWRVSVFAAVLQIPYILWTAFAAYLNAAAYFLN